MLQINFVIFLFLAPAVANVQSAIEFIYPLLVNFNAGPRSETVNSKTNEAHFVNKKRRLDNRVHIPDNYDMESSEEDYSDEEFDSDESQD